MSESEHRYALKPGHKIHWYQIESILGKGGFGITYLARDLNLDKPVAIKEYLPSEFAVREEDSSVHPLSDQTEEHFHWGLDRFIKEARTLSRFEHPNIVRVHAVFEENNTGYMVMAYENGQSLKDLLKAQQTLDEVTLLALFLPIIDGLERVHGQGFIHRDIKPDNIYVRDDGSPVLLDFGSARQAAGGDHTMTSLVSPGYAPFEQYYAKGEEQGPWTDIYGLGATLYRAVTGKKPMDAVYRSGAMIENERDTMETATALAQGRYSPAFLAAIDHAVQFRPGNRPQTLAEWKAELEKAGREAEAIGSPASQPSDGLHQQATLQAPAEENATRVQSRAHYPSPETPPAANNTPGKSAARIWVAGTVAVSLTLAGGFYVYQSSTVTEPASERATSGPAESHKLNAQQLIEEQKRQAEAARRLEEKHRQEEADRIAREKAAAEQHRQEELEKARRQKELAKQAEEKRRRDMEKQIAESQAFLASRQAREPDRFAYDDNTDAQPLSAPNDTKTVNVPAASQAWFSTGVALERGKRYQITASGTWKMGAFCNPSDATGNGIYTLACWDGGGQTVAGYSHGALIGKIGKDTLAFHVGPRLEFTSPRNGTLYFMSNDTASFIGDNSGILQVTIRQPSTH